MASHYSMMIQWSAEDGVFVVSFPEFPFAHTHGASYEEAARNGQDVLDLLLQSYEETRRCLPAPSVFAYATA